MEKVKIGKFGISTYTDNDSELNDTSAIKAPCVKNIAASDFNLTVYNSCTKCKTLTIAWLTGSDPIFKDYKIPGRSSKKIKMVTGNSTHAGEIDC